MSEKTGIKKVIGSHEKAGAIDFVSKAVIIILENQRNQETHM